VLPLLVFGWGNLSRGDDALGPLCVEQLRAEWTAGAVGVVSNFWMTTSCRSSTRWIWSAARGFSSWMPVELHGPFEVTPLMAAQDASFTTHALSPQALMQVFVDLQGVAPPPCTLLAIRGERFELGEPPSASALENLEAATQWARTWLQPF
jgi:hypothetical protein